MVVAKTLSQRIDALRYMGLYEEASDYTGNPHELARVLVKWEGQFDKAIATFDEVVRRYGEETSPELQLQVADALVDKGESLDKQGRYDDAIRFHI